jgi:hypothetical protein
MFWQYKTSRLPFLNVFAAVHPPSSSYRDIIPSESTRSVYNTDLCIR